MHAMKGYRWLTLQNFTNFDGSTLGFLVTMKRLKASAQARCREKLFNNSLFLRLRARSRSSRPTLGKRRIPRNGLARKSRKCLQTRLGRRTRRLRRKGRVNNNAEAGAAAWEAAASEAAGLDFPVAALRVVAEDIRAVAEDIRVVAEADIRMIAAE